METFNPLPSEPATDLLDSIESFIRNGHPYLHDPAPPAWAAGDPCPAGHFCLPEGTTFYRGDIPADGDLDHFPYLVIEIGGDCERHVPDSDIYWNIPVAIHLVDRQDAWEDNDTPAVMRDLRQDLLADARLTSGPHADDYPATQRLTTATIHVYHIYDVQFQRAQLTNGHPAHTLLFKVRCAAKSS